MSKLVVWLPSGNNIEIRMDGVLFVYGTELFEAIRDSSYTKLELIQHVEETRRQTYTPVRLDGKQL